MLTMLTSFKVGRVGDEVLFGTQTEHTCHFGLKPKCLSGKAVPQLSCVSAFVLGCPP